MSNVRNRTRTWLCGRSDIDLGGGTLGYERDAFGC